MKKTINALTAPKNKLDSAEVFVEQVLTNITDIADDDNIRDDCFDYAEGAITKAQLIKRLNTELRYHEDSIKDIKKVLKEAAKDIYPKRVPQVVYDLTLGKKSTK